MADLRSPRCPLCEWPPTITPPGGDRAYCSNDDCRLMDWNPSKSPRENLIEAGVIKAPYRILVTGSRDWADESLIAGALLHEASRVPASRGIIVVHGGARGADMLADRVALHYEWQTEPHRADWDRFGKSAGYRRNAEMVALGADICLAFIRDGSHGATHCAEAARKAGVPVRYFRA